MLLTGFNTFNPVSTPVFSFVMDILSNSDFDLALSIYLLISFEFDDIDKISFIKSCSGEMTAKVIPNRVSGLVVKTSKFKSLSSIFKLN